MLTRRKLLVSRLCPSPPRPLPLYSPSCREGSFSETSGSKPGLKEQILLSLARTHAHLRHCGAMYTLLGVVNRQPLPPRLKIVLAQPHPQSCLARTAL